MLLRAAEEVEISLRVTVVVQVGDVSTEPAQAILLAPSQPAASESHQGGQRGAGRHLSATWLLSAGIVRHMHQAIFVWSRNLT